MILIFSDFLDDLSKRLPERVVRWIENIVPGPMTWEKVVRLFLHNINQRPLTGILKEIHSGILNGGLKPKPPSDPKEFFQRIDARKTDKKGQAWREWLSNLIDRRYRLAFRGNWTITIFKKQLELLSVPAELASK